MAGVGENAIKLMYSIHSYYKRLVKKGWVECGKVNEKRVCIDDFHSSSTLSSFSLIRLSLKLPLSIVANIHNVLFFCDTCFMPISG